jgi:tRNA G37 N-methylase Trm5
MTFSLFQSHIDLAHHYWKALVKEDDIVVDATCGNGHDTLFLAKLKPQKLYSIDLQARALDSAKKLLLSHLSAEECASIEFVEGNHQTFPKEILSESVKLLVYNFGYLPGADKSITTLAESSLQSLKTALSLIVGGGAISLTCYPGHAEGLREEKSLLAFIETLNPREWSCCLHRWSNRNQAPNLLFLQKSTNPPKTH